MFGVARRNPLRRKDRIFDLSLHHGLLPFRWSWRALVDELQRLQDSSRIGTATGHPAAFRPTLQVERHQPHGRQRLQRPLRRQIDPGFLQPATKKSLHQQGQCGHKNMSLHSCFDLMIDRPQRHHVFELPEPVFDLAQVLVQRHGIEDAQAYLTGRDHIFPFDLLFAA